MPDPIRTNVLVTASYGHYGQRAARIGPYCICLIRIPTSDSVPFFPQTITILCTTDPGPIWMAWSGFDQTHQIPKQADVRESSGPVSGRTHKPATSFPLSDSVAFFHRRPGSYCAKPGRIRFGSGWLCQVLAKRIRSGSNSMCKNHPARIWPMLPCRSGPDANRIRHVYWDIGVLPDCIGVLPDCAIPCKPDTFLCAWLADTDAAALDPTSQNREREKLWVFCSHSLQNMLLYRQHWRHFNCWIVPITSTWYKSFRP